MTVAQILHAFSAIDLYSDLMAPQEIQKMLKQEPFMPLQVHVADGSVYQVHSPSDALMSMLVLTIGIDPDDESGLFRNTVYISPSHVSRIVPMPATKAG